MKSELSTSIPDGRHVTSSHSSFRHDELDPLELGARMSPSSLKVLLTVASLS